MIVDFHTDLHTAALYLSGLAAGDWIAGVCTLGLHCAPTPAPVALRPGSIRAEAALAMNIHRQVLATASQSGEFESFEADWPLTQAYVALSGSAALRAMHPNGDEQPIREQLSVDLARARKLLGAVYSGSENAVVTHMIWNKLLADFSVQALRDCVAALAKRVVEQGSMTSEEIHAHFSEHPQVDEAVEFAEAPWETLLSDETLSDYDLILKSEASSVGEVR